MNLTFLRNFLCFTNHMSITGAARELKLSPSTIFVQLQQLQKMLGKDLYYQGSDGLKLTRAGHELAILQRELTEKASDFEAFVLNKSKSVNLIFAANANLMLYWIKPLLGNLRQENFSLYLRTYELPMAAEHILEAKIHFALGECFKVPSDLIFTPLIDCHYCLVGPDRSSWLGEVISLGDLTSVDLILPSKHIGWRAKLDEQVEELGYTIKIAAEVEVADLAVQLIQAGLGYGILPSYCTLPSGMRRWRIIELPVAQVGWIERSHTIDRQILVNFKKEVTRYVRGI